MDFAGSDSVLGDADYNNVDDLLMVPAVAGAVVPIYNIPELLKLSTPLVLSRTTITRIFMGKILYWNDPAILSDAPVGAVKTALQSLGSVPINVVVRDDSSGTSEIFTKALASFDAAGLSSPDYSFGKLGTAGSTPTWCGPLTDEVQDIKISGCNASAPSALQTITLRVVSANRTLEMVSFYCDSNVTDLVTYIGNTLYPVAIYPVSKTVDATTGLITFRIAYTGQSSKNWYQPVVVSVPTGTSVSIATVQEGGYKNAPYSGTTSTLYLTKSLWLNSPASSPRSWFTFRLSWNSTAVTAAINSTSSSADLSATIKTAINALYPGACTAVSRSSLRPPYTWVEYQIKFSTAAESSGAFASLHAQNQTLPSHATSTSLAYVNTLTSANNYPQFYDKTNPTGYSASGR
jgi:hypothetical protein